MRIQLVTYAIASIALPIALSGGIVFFFLAYHLDVIEASFTESRHALTRDVAGADIRAQASNIAHQIDAFLLERIVDARTWASAQVVVEAARDAHVRHTDEGFTDASPDAVESRFRIHKSLGAAPEAVAYLRRQVAASPHFAEVFFTDRNGFNVALTNPTSDFIQSDESWWQNAWSRGISVGEVEYDESAGLWSVDISVRIGEPDTGEPIGVMKTVLGIKPVQQLADRAAQAIPDGRVHITTGHGVIIAETSSGHARARIMNPTINLREQGGPSIRAAFGGERADFAVDQDWLAGYARTGGQETYAGTTGHFAGFDWIVILQKPAAQVHAPITVLHAIDDALRDWRRLLALGLGAMVLTSAIAAIALGALAARRITASVRAVREMAERAARGEEVTPTAIRHSGEFARLHEAVHRLSQLFATVLRRNRPRS